MPNDFIRIDPTLTPNAQFYGSQLITLVVSLRATIDQLDRIKAVMEHSTDGTTFTTLEAMFGLGAGKGQTVFDFINGTRGALGGTMTNSNAFALIDRVG
jgi:hypothetical protein